MSHISAGRGEAAWSRSCPKCTALCASPSPNNSLDHLTSTKSCLRALCKKQHVISASGCPILPSNTFLARTKSLGQRSSFYPPSSPQRFSSRLGSLLLGWRLWGQLSPTCRCGCVSILSALAQGSAEHSRAVWWNAFPASCTETSTYCTLVGCSGKIYVRFLSVQIEPKYHSVREVGLNRAEWLEEWVLSRLIIFPSDNAVDYTAIGCWEYADLNLP